MVLRSRPHVADNDYACDQFVDLISHSPIWNQTATAPTPNGEDGDGEDRSDEYRRTQPPWSL